MNKLFAVLIFVLPAICFAGGQTGQPALTNVSNTPVSGTMTIGNGRQSLHGAGQVASFSAPTNLITIDGIGGGKLLAGNGIQLSVSGSTITVIATGTGGGGGGSGTVTSITVTGALGSQTITTTGTLSLATNIGIAHQWISSVSAGNFVFTQPSFSDLSGVASTGQIPALPYLSNTTVLLTNATSLVPGVSLALLNGTLTATGTATNPAYLTSSSTLSASQLSGGTLTIGGISFSGTFPISTIPTIPGSQVSGTVGAALVSNTATFATTAGNGGVTSVNGATGAITGILNTGSAALFAPASQGIASLTTTGTSGPSTFSGGTLNIPQYSGGGGGGSAYDALSPLVYPQVSVTSATNFTYATEYVISGTASLSGTLPPASGNAGKFVRVSVALTPPALFTLSGSGSALIDGTNSRIMWQYESATVECDGTNWRKVAGKSVPMACKVFMSANPSIGNATAFQLPLDTTAYDTSGMSDLINNRIKILRPSQYVISGSVIYNNIGPCNNAQGQIYFNGTVTIAGWSSAYTSGMYPNPLAAGTLSMNAGDNLTLYAYQTSGGSVNLFLGIAALNYLQVLEEPTW